MTCLIRVFQQESQVESHALETIMQNINCIAWHPAVASVRRRAGKDLT